MTEFISINETLSKINSKKISIKELNEIFIKRIKEKENLNIFIYFDEEKVLNQIKDLEKNSIKGNLNGIPLGIKDLFCTSGMPTTAGSKILENFNPTYESFVTQKLLDNGSIFIGKTNLDEFAMGSATNTSFFGNTINPLSAPNKPLVPGGSSGGSAAAVAATAAAAAAAVAAAAATAAQAAPAAAAGLGGRERGRDGGRQ